MVPVMFLAWEEISTAGWMGTMTYAPGLSPEHRQFTLSKDLRFRQPMGHAVIGRVHDGGASGFVGGSGSLRFGAPRVTVRLASQSRWRRAASGSTCAFCAEIAEIMEIAEISCLPEGAGTLVFRAAGANASRRSQYLGVLCANSGRNADTDVSNDSPRRSTSLPSARHRSYGLFRNKIERDPTRDAVRAMGCL